MQITDPIISENGSVYSLAGIRRLLQEVTKAGGVGKRNNTEKKRGSK